MRVLGLQLLRDDGRSAACAHLRAARQVDSGQVDSCPVHCGQGQAPPSHQPQPRRRRRRSWRWWRRPEGVRAVCPDCGPVTVDLFAHGGSGGATTISHRWVWCPRCGRTDAQLPATSPFLRRG
ncbi:MAG TPA: hypothetical protein VIK95_15260 [Egibacteraceae bacterium]